MSAALKIPEALVSDVVVRHHEGWSLRRIATWLTDEKQVDVSRSAVSGALVRAGEPDPEPLDDAYSELIEEAPTNLHKLEALQEEAEKTATALMNKTIDRDHAVLVVKLLAQRERILLWKLRAAGLRAPPASDPFAGPAPRTRGRPQPLVARPNPLPSRPIERAPMIPAKPREPEVGRNAPCPCGSGQKYKKCHGGPNPSAAVTHAVMSDTAHATERKAGEKRAVQTTV
jgi:hypothetical protein